MAKGAGANRGAGGRRGANILRASSAAAIGRQLRGGLTAFRNRSRAQRRRRRPGPTAR